MKTFATLAFTAAAFIGLASPAYADCTAGVECSVSRYVHVDTHCDPADCLICIGRVCPIP